MLSKRISYLKFFFKDPNKKNVLTMTREIISYGWNKKEVPIDYFRKTLYRKEVKNPNSYLSLKQYYNIITSKKILVPDIAQLLENKLHFALFAERTALPTPELISYNFKQWFYYKDKHYYIESPSKLIAFFSLVFETSKQNSLFIKPSSGIGGSGCLLLKKEELNQQIKTHGSHILANNYIHQEKVKQHPAINTIYEPAVNTIRIYSYLDKKGNSHILSALMRFGSGGLNTDNASTGGLYIAVNTENNSLKGLGRTNFIKGNKVFKYHPDTNTLLDGYNLPYLQESLKLVKLAAKKLPTRLIGWDIAISKNGPLIIEGNTNASLNIADISYGGYCKHPLIQEILNEIKN